MKTVNRLVFVCLFIFGAFSTSTAMACTTALWLGAETGTPVAGSPAAVSRVSGLCAMQLTAAGGSVTDNSPSVETTAIIRFYVFAQLASGTPVIFEAFSGNDGGGSSLITVTIDGSNFIFNAGSGPSAPVAGKSGWNLVELAWTGGANMEYWVNTDATSVGSQGSVAAAAGTMESVVLGAAGTLDGKLTFDDYESHRSTAVGGRHHGIRGFGCGRHVRWQANF